MSPPSSHPLRLTAWAVLLVVLLCVRAVEAIDPKVKEWVKVYEDNERDSWEQKKRERAIRELGKIGGVDAARALMPVFRDPFVHLHDHAVSAWITMLKGSEGPDTQTFLTMHAVYHKDVAVRRGAAVALGVTGGAELEEPLRVAIAREKDGHVLQAWAEAALRLRGEPDLAGIFLPKLKHKHAGAVFAAAQAAVRFDGQVAVKSLLRVLKHRSPLARAGAVLALQRLNALPLDDIEPVVFGAEPAPAMALAESLAFRTKVLPWPGAGELVLEHLLAHDSWRVRAAAIQGALRIWEKGIVDLLMARLGKEQGRLADDLRRALETFTRAAIGEDPDLWRAWWIRKHSAFDPGPRPALDRAGNVPFREAAHEDARDGTRTVSFFNLPLRSQRLAFVFDLSGSMRNAAEKGSDKGPTKLDLLRREFQKTLEGLAEDTVFDVFVYRYWSGYPPKTKLTRALGKLKPCSKANVKKALGWMEKQEAKGWGAFYEPLEALLAQDVDTIVLLSDGRPSRGRYDRDVRLLAEFPKANRFHRVAVNTVLVGTKGADRKFMADLAVATGGRFQEAGGP